MKEIALENKEFMDVWNDEVSYIMTEHYKGLKVHDVIRIRQIKKEEGILDKLRKTKKTTGRSIVARIKHIRIEKTYIGVIVIIQISVIKSEIDPVKGK